MEPSRQRGSCAGVPSEPGRVPEGQVFSRTLLCTPRPSCLPPLPASPFGAGTAERCSPFLAYHSLCLCLCLSLSPHRKLHRHIGWPWGAASLLTRLRLPVWGAVLLVPSP